MNLSPNNNNKYIFFIGYDENKWTLFYINDDINNYKDYNSCEITNEELLNSVIEAILNGNEINVTDDRLVSGKVNNIDITDKNSIVINKYKNRIHLRFYIVDVGEYYKVEKIFDDNGYLTIEQYKHIFEITSGFFDMYEKIANALNSNKYVYLPKSKSLDNIKIDDILVVDKNMKLIFNVKDNGNSYEVTGINDNEIVVLGSINSTYEIYSWSIYEEICSAYLSGKKVYLPKNMNSSLTMDDIVIENIGDELELSKRMASIAGKDIIYSTRLDKVSVINSCKYIQLVLYFISLGFFITESNREEKYIELINYVSELEDENKSEEIINKFEEYLTMVDKVNINSSYIKALDDFLDNISSAATKEEVEKILNDFKDNWK